MGLYTKTEEFLLEMQKRQKHVHPALKDYGIVVDSPNSPECLEIKDALWNSLLFSSLRKHRRETRTNNIIQVTLSIFIPKDTINKNTLECTKWDVAYTDHLVHKVRFLKFTTKELRASRMHVWGVGYDEAKTKK